MHRTVGDHAQVCKLGSIEFFAKHGYDVITPLQVC